MFHTAQQRFILSGSSGQLDVVQNALWPPQGPGSGAPEPPPARPVTHALSPSREAVPARWQPPVTPPAPPSYEELYPEYA